MDIYPQIKIRIIKKIQQINQEVQIKYNQPKKKKRENRKNAASPN